MLHYDIFVAFVVRLVSDSVDRRRHYDDLIERVFRQEEKRHESSVSKVDIDNLEKEVGIDIAELRKDLRNLRRDLLLQPDSFSSGDLLSVKSRKNSAGVSEAGHGHAGRWMAKGSFVSETSVPEEADDVSCFNSPPIQRKSVHARSFKTDNNPELVRHLVQTLGLIGVSDQASAPKKLNRQVSFKTQPTFDRCISSS